MPSITYWPEMTFPATGEGYSTAEGPYSNPWYSYRPISAPTGRTLSADTALNEAGLYRDISYDRPIECNTPYDVETRSPYSESEKPPLTQLQELTNVFSTPSTCSNGQNNNNASDIDNVQCDKSPPESTKLGTIVHYNKDNDNVLVNHDSDSGYVTDLAIKDTTDHKTGDNDEVLTTNDNSHLYPLEDHEHNGGEYMGQYQNGGEDERHHSYSYNNEGYIDNIDDYQQQHMFDANYNVINHTNVNDGKILPGFQQAFGSTEIGRFSRNDFFTNPPSTEESLHTNNRSNVNNDLEVNTIKKGRSKTPRKPRGSRKKNIQIEDEKLNKNEYEQYDCYDRSCETHISEKPDGCVKCKNKSKRTTRGDKRSDSYRVHDSSPSFTHRNHTTPNNFYPQLPTYRDEMLPSLTGLPTYANTPSSNIRFNYNNPHQYSLRNNIDSNSYQSRSYLTRTPEYDSHMLRSEYYPRYPCPQDTFSDCEYPYVRNSYSSYPTYDPYFRPLGLNFEYNQPWGQSSDWSSRNTSWSNWSGQSWLPGQPHTSNWTSSNMFPYMRLDY